MRGLQVARIHPQVRVLTLAQAFSKLFQVKRVALVETDELDVLLFDAFRDSSIPNFVVNV